MKYLNRIKISSCSWLYPFIALFMLCNGSYADEVAVIKIKYHRADEMLPIVRTILSPGAKVTVATRVNSLVIVDNPDAIQRVRDYLAAFDIPVEQVRIRVRFHERLTDTERSESIDGRLSGKDWSMATDKRTKDGIEFNLEQRKRLQTSVSEYFVTTASGNPAYISTGKEIPYLENGGYLSHRHRRTTGPGTVTFKEVETGFEVTPRIVGDHADLKIVPRIAYDETEGGVIRFHGAQTNIMVPLGQWVEVAGSDGQQNEIINEILTQRRGDEMVSLSMAVMVEKL
jgi:type II secretory pathway component HofQ